MCLAALGGAFLEVLVVDSGSSDSTRQIALDAGVKVLDFSWDGKFPKKRNWTLRNHPFSTPWVLFLDADERVTAEFISELEAVLPTTDHVGFWIGFQNWFMGQPLRHGDPFRKLALFRVGAGEYERFPEDSWSHLDMEVHEHPVLDGPVGQIDANLQHHDYRGLKHYIAKHNEYSSWEAERYLWLRSSGVEAWDKLTKRQRFKYRNLNKRWLALFYWMIAYVLKFGFLDGATGWNFAMFKWRYFTDIRLKIRETDAVR